ncbi:MAG: regulatory protein RecX [Candidatus Firestonebacteria bacterium]
MEQKQKAKNYVYYLLFQSSKTKKEIIDKLKKKSYNEDVIKEVVQEIEDSDLINDEKYALDFTSDRLNFKKAGKILIKRQLWQKGIDKKIIDDVVEKVFSDVDEYKIALELARKRIKIYKKLDEKIVVRRLQGFLLRRGYNFDTTIRVIKSLIKKIDYEE